MTTLVPVPAAVGRLWNRIPPSRRLPLTVFAICQVILLLWWAAFFPGLMSYDTIAYVWQVTTNNWMGNHSILYDSFVWLSLQITGDLWLLTLVQTVAMSAALAYTCVALRDLGAKGRWSGLAAVALVSIPATGALTVFIWKDTAFTISSLVAFAALTRLLARRIKGRQLVRDRSFYRQIILVTISFLGIALFRNNSVIVLVFAFPFLFFALGGMRRWITVLTAGTGAIYLLLQFVVYPGVGIVPPRTDQVYAFNYADIAYAYSQHPAIFTAEDKAVMEKVAPLSFWGGHAANCYDVDYTFAKPFNTAAADKYNTQLLDIWFDVFKNNPQDIAYAHICRAQIAWSLFPGPASESADTLISGTSIPGNLFTWTNWQPEVRNSPYRPILKTRTLDHTLHSAAAWYYKLSTVRQLQWLLWRGALWCYVAYGVVIAYAWRKRTRVAYGLVGITVGLQLTVLAANPAQLARYMLPPFYIGIMLLSLLSALRTKSTAAGAAAADPAVLSGPPQDGPAAPGSGGSTVVASSADPAGRPDDGKDSKVGVGAGSGSAKDPGDDSGNDAEVDTGGQVSV